MKELTRITTATRLLDKAAQHHNKARITRDLLVVKAAEAGATQTQIAAAADMKQPSVYAILKKYEDGKAAIAGGHD